MFHLLLRHPLQDEIRAGFQLLPSAVCSARFLQARSIEQRRMALAGPIVPGFAARFLRACSHLAFSMGFGILASMSSSEYRRLAALLLFSFSLVLSGFCYLLLFPLGFGCPLDFGYPYSASLLHRACWRKSATFWFSRFVSLSVSRSHWIPSNFDPRILQSLSTLCNATVAHPDAYICALPLAFDAVLTFSIHAPVLRCAADLIARLADNAQAALAISKAQFALLPPFQRYKPLDVIIALHNHSDKLVSTHAGLLDCGFFSALVWQTFAYDSFDLISFRQLQ